MTGTSFDALDVAVLRIRHFGLRMHAKLEATSTVPLGKLAAPLRRLAEQQPMAAGEIATLQREFSLLHLEALEVGDAIFVLRLGPFDGFIDGFVFFLIHDYQLAP